MLGWHDRLESVGVQVPTLDTEWNLDRPDLEAFLEPADTGLDTRALQSIILPVRSLNE